MITKALRTQAIPELLQSIRESMTHLVAPIEEDGIRLFRLVDRVEDVVLDEGNTRWSFKEVLFPRTEPLFHYRFRGNEVELSEPKLPEGEVVIFGARPCDAAGMEVLDAVFSWGRTNPFYQHRRKQTTIIGLSCAEPAPSCFCTAVGLSPTGAHGCDLLLTPMGEETLVEVITLKGEAFVEKHARFFTDTNLTKEEATRAAEAKIQRNTPIAVGKELPLDEVFNSPKWEEYARGCLGCGACAFLCPTCHCFDIVDEGDARGGSRCKNWDACGFALFTQHTSGHNPRSTQPARYRQRALHKFRYLPERLEVTGCVGCGRCVASCPVNMDIYEVATGIFPAAPKAADAEEQE